MSVLGKPTCRQLTQMERNMLDTSPSTLPSQVVIYYKVYLKDAGRIISSRSSSRSILRVNSGLMYSNSHGSFSYAKLVRIILFPDCNGYAVIIPLHPFVNGICKDSLTGAKINDHIVSLHPPRYSCQCTNYNLRILMYFQQVH